MTISLLDYTQLTIQNLKLECESAGIICQEIFNELNEELPYPVDIRLHESFEKIQTIYKSSLATLFYTHYARRTLAITTLDFLLEPFAEHILGADNSARIQYILLNHTAQMHQLRISAAAIDEHAYQWKEKLLSLLSAGADVDS